MEHDCRGSPCYEGVSLAHQVQLADGEVFSELGIVLGELVSGDVYEGAVLVEELGAAGIGRGEVYPAVYEAEDHAQSSVGMGRAGESVQVYEGGVQLDGWELPDSWRHFVALNGAHCLRFVSGTGYVGKC